MILGGLAVALGAAGLVLPVLPTVPFLLLAAFCFARSSDRLHDWILSHPVYGPPIRNWRAEGRVPRRAKVIACASMGTGFGIAAWLALPLWILVLQAAVLLSVAAWLVTRPE